MARDRDWVDYANLASNIAQNVQIRDMRHKLGTVASVMQEEKDTAERENKLRDAVFQSESMLRNLQKASNENPRGSLALARHNLLQFQCNEVTSASFRSYEDKERLRSVVEGHEQLIQECAAGLSPQQQDQAERCGQYLAERGELDLLIRLSQKQAELDRLKAEHQVSGADPRTGIGITIGILALALCLIGGTLWFIGSENEEPENKSNGQISLALGGIGIVVAALLLARQFQIDARQAQAMEKFKTETARLIADEPLLDPAFNMVSVLRETFGNASGSDLLQMRNDREALIADVLGKAAPPSVT